jgi:hypothetical protein
MATQGLRQILFTVLVVTPAVAAAFCEDPKTGISGYHIRLAEEIKTSTAIVIGRVVEKREIHDEPSDPESFSATIYKVIVERTLKGKVGKVVVLWTPNDSSRYPMSAGERHVLFLTASRDQDSLHFEADGCESSSTLPGGSRVVAQVEAAMRPNTSLERTRDR